MYLVKMKQLLKRRNQTVMVVLCIFFLYLGSQIALSYQRFECDSVTKYSAEHMESSKYAVLILTGPDNEERRNAIRYTWIQLIDNVYEENGPKNQWSRTKVLKNEFIKYYFVIGTQKLEPNKFLRLKSEHDKHQDLLFLESVQDSYSTLTIKLMQSFKWLSENLNNFKYLIKCDDDSFVRIDRIVQNLEDYAPKMDSPDISSYVTYKNINLSRGLYWGYFNGRAQVARAGRWKEDQWFLCDRYLPYAVGGGYVVSRNIVDYIAKNIDMLSFYNSEDVSMGVWTAALEGINRIHDIRFDTEWKSRGCNEKMLVRHKQNPKDMHELYDTLRLSEGRKICLNTMIERPHYYYKWNVPPSECCQPVNDKW